MHVVGKPVPIQVYQKRLGTVAHMLESGSAGNTCLKQVDPATGGEDVPVEHVGGLGQALV